MANTNRPEVFVFFFFLALQNKTPCIVFNWLEVPHNSKEAVKKKKERKEKERKSGTFVLLLWGFYLATAPEVLRAACQHAT